MSEMIKHDGGNSLSNDAMQLLLNLTPEQLAQAALMLTSKTEQKLELVAKRTNDLSDNLIEVKYKADATENRIGNLENLLIDRIKKQDYVNSDSFKEMRALGREMKPPVLNKMAIILKWLGIVYYDTGEGRHVPYASAIKNDIVRARTCENKKSGYPYTEYTYNTKKVIAKFTKKLEEYGLYDEYNSLITKEERDRWIDKNLVA